MTQRQLHNQKSGQQRHPYMKPLSMRLSQPDLEVAGPVCHSSLATVTMCVTLGAMPCKSYFTYFLSLVCFHSFLNCKLGILSIFRKQLWQLLNALWETAGSRYFPSCMSYCLHHSNSPFTCEPQICPKPGRKWVGLSFSKAIYVYQKCESIYVHMSQNILLLVIIFYNHLKFQSHS